MWKIFLLVILFLLLGGLYIYSNLGGGSINDGNDSEILRIGENAIYIPAQRPGSAIAISFVSLAKPGFVVIQENEGGKPGAILGNSRLLPKGESKNSSFRIIRSLRNGEALFAVLYEDSGDSAFSPKYDIPVRDESGNIIFMEFNVDSRAPAVQDINI
jgi:hypothetical protein